ncbi:hypothetical protein Marme_2183 [Marinomonas mediterranea MMB-1]|uniref:UmuC domain-containing protein n=2 Tax=Marinomonas mediterranea TaxID=119864 RepID=F2K4N3_MARM1|nr:hypothetical protein Marme_2183 [Marinomonas mediterranea MMB-1]
MWMAFYFPQLSLEALGIDKGSEPVALISQQTQKLLLCNQQAQSKGLKEGMSLSLAYSFDSELQLREADPQAESEQLEALALCLNQFSATVSISPPQAILIEVASMLRYFGNETVIAQKAHMALRMFSDSYQVGFAKSGKLALWRALSEQPLRPSPNWQTLNEDDWIKDIPIDRLDWSPEHIQRLQGMGFDSLTSLYRLPTALLRRHLGVGLYTQFGHALGFIKESYTPYQAPEMFTRERIFEYEIENSLGLLFPLRPIIQSMCLFLKNRRKVMYAFDVSLTLAWSVEQERQPIIRVQHDLGSDDAQLWLELTELKLNRLSLQAPIRSMRIDIVKMEQSEEESGDLFNDTKQQTRDQNLFLSRLQARLGNQSIQAATLTNDHLPEQAMCFQPISICNNENQKNDKQRKQKSKIGEEQEGKNTEKQIDTRELAQRPTWQIHHPERISPRQFNILEGPERISSAWWCETSTEYTFRRDYYIAHWVDGRKAWVFRDDAGAWYLHGWFG